MSNRPSKGFLICMTSLLVSGAAGAWAWNKATKMPAEKRKEISFLKAIGYYHGNGDFAPLTAGQQAKIQPLLKAVVEREESEFPRLKVTEHPVPDDQNGFLQVYKLSGAPGFNGRLVPEEFDGMLDETEPWDPVRAKRLLAENPVLVDRIEAIAALKDRSSVNLPKEFNGYFGVHHLTRAAEILQMKARLAAEAKDEGEALRLTKAVFNLTGHATGIEASTLLGETVAALIELNMQRQVFSYFLPALGRDADLAQWKSILGTRSYSAAAFSGIMRSEWQSGGKLMALPLLLNDECPDHPADAVALIHVLASRYNDLVTVTEDCRLGELDSRMARLEASFAAPPMLSEESRNILGVMFTGERSWSQGYVRAAIVSEQYQAALDLLMREKRGAVLTVDSTKEVSRDPVSGNAFAYDPVDRIVMLAAADERAGVKPLKLPW